MSKQRMPNLTSSAPSAPRFEDEKYLEPVGVVPDYAFAVFAEGTSDAPDPASDLSMDFDIMIESFCAELDVEQAQEGRAI